MITKLEKMAPSASKPLLAALIPPVKCTKAAANANDKAKALECQVELVPRALVLIPGTVAFPQLGLIFLYAVVLVLVLILKLSLGIGTIHDVNEAYKSVAIMVANALAE